MKIHLVVLLPLLADERQGYFTHPVANHMAMPALWYILLSIVSICGVAVWYIRNFTRNLQLLRVIAGIGAAAMATLLFWTWQMDV